MNDTLKVAGRIGAELGAAKAEAARLRELLRDVEFRGLLTGWEPGLIGQITAALSQQPEPTDTYTAVDMATAAAQGFRDGQAAAEQAAAQDERELPPPYGWVAVGEFFTDRAKAIEAAEKTPCIEVYSRPQMLTRPAQTEQQPPYPHEAMDVIATSRYQVVASGSGPLSRYYVRAGDGKCELYRGGKSDCEHVARKLAGAFLDGGLTAFGLYAAPIAQTAPQGKFRMGDLVKKSTGSEWVGHVCGWYSTNQTPEGYAVESEAHKGSVQIYPAKALEAVE